MPGNNVQLPGDGRKFQNLPNEVHVELSKMPQDEGVPELPIQPQETHWQRLTFLNSLASMSFHVAELV